jgi:hypothetical protein
VLILRHLTVQKDQTANARQKKAQAGQVLQNPKSRNHVSELPWSIIAEARQSRALK